MFRVDWSISASICALGSAAAILIAGCGEKTTASAPLDALVSGDASVPTDSAVSGAGVMYFIAVHCDPGAEFPDEFVNLEAMIASASEAGIRLTLMFTPQWASFLGEEPGRLERLDVWSAAGHEIAMHHHSVYHPGTWDGYTDFEFEEYAPIRGLAKAEKTEKLGSLADFDAVLEGMYPGMKAGCANAEIDKNTMPASITHDTCSGFYTTYAYPLGTRSDGGDTLIGVNDFVLVGTTPDGIQRRWLGHGMISAPFIEDSEATIGAMEAGAHGVAVHTKAADVDAVESWTEILLALDGGAGSATVSQIIDSGVLPEEHLAGEILNAVEASEPSGGKPPGAGDGPPGPPD